MASFTGRQYALDAGKCGFMLPSVWFMENVTAIDSASISDAHDASDLEVICSTLREELPGF